MNLKKWQIDFICTVLLFIPMGLFNLWIYLFKDYNLANLLHILTIFLIPTIFKKITDLELNMLVKGVGDYLNLNLGHDSKSSKILLILVVLSLGSISLVYFIFFNNKFIIDILLPNTNTYINIIIVILTILIFIILVPIFEGKYFFEFGYDVIDNEILKKIVMGIIFGLKYYLVIKYLTLNSFYEFIVIILTVVMIYAWITHIHSGNNLNDAVLSIRACNLIFIVLILLVHLLKLKTPVIAYDGNNIFTRIFKLN